MQEKDAAKHYTWHCPHIFEKGGLVPFQAMGFRFMRSATNSVVGCSDVLYNAEPVCSILFHAGFHIKNVLQG